jgi:hypothetical protein
MSYSLPKNDLSSSVFTEKPEVFSVAGVFQLRTWSVGPRGNFLTLSAALASSLVQPGDRLLLEAGSTVDATSPIVINKDITIEGQTAGSLVTPNAGTPAMLFDLQTANVYLKNLTFQAPSAGSCVSTSAGTRVNLYCEGCTFEGPSVLYPSGNNIQFVSCAFVKADSNLARIPLQFQSFGHEATGGNGEIINIDACTFQDFSSNLSTAIQVTFLAGVTHPIRINGCSYTGSKPHNALLKIVAGATADENVKIPLWVLNNNISTGNILAQIVAGTAATPLLLDNLSYVKISGNTISNSSGYGFLTCDRTGSSPARIDLGTGTLINASSNTSTNPTTVRAGYAAGTVEGSTVLLTYNSAKFNAYSKAESSLDASDVKIPDPVPVASSNIRVDSSSFYLVLGDNVLIPNTWNAKFTGIYRVGAQLLTDSWTKVLSPSDLSDGSLVVPAQGNVYDKTAWVSSGGGITKLFSGSDFGTGADGDVTISGTVTLTADKFYRNLTVPSGAVLNPSGYRVYVYESLAVGYGGSISMDGADGSGQTAGSGYLSLGTLGVSSGAGGAGGNGGVSAFAGVAGSSPQGTLVTAHFVGVAGTTYEGGIGSAGTAAGGVAGTVAAAAEFNGGFDKPHDRQAGFSLRTGSSFSGGAGGGGGGGHSTVGNVGGGGGAGGGGIWISARQVYNSGSITSNGGDGGNGVGSAGGGAGGGGGWVSLQYGSGDPGFVTANGGKTGTGGTPSTAARAGKVTLTVI